MGIAIKKLFAELLFWLYDMLDALSEMFGVLAGTETITYNSYENMTLLEVFLSHNTVTQVFLALFLVSIAVCAVCMVAGIVKGVVAIRAENRHSPVHTVGLGFMSLIATLVTVVILIAGISFSDALLIQINKYVLEENNVTLSQRLFDLSVESSYEMIYADVSECDINSTTTVIYDGITYTGVYKTKQGGTYYYTINGDTVSEDDLDYITETVNYVVYNGVTYKDVYATYDDDGNIDGVAIYAGYYDDDGVWHRTYQTGYAGDYTAEDIDFKNMTVDEVFGVHKKMLGVYEDSDKGYTTQPMVYLDSFNFWTAYLTVVIIIVAILWAMLGLVKRLYDLVLLFIIMPIVTATIPLDEGARFKVWRDTVISKIIMAYGTVLAVNVFLLIVPIIGSLDVIFSSTTATTIFKLLLYIGGALCISGGQLLVARIAGTDGAESRDIAQSARTLLTAGKVGGVAALGTAAAAKRFTFGGTNRHGTETRGLIPTALGAGNRIAETAGGSNYMNSNGAYVMRKISRAPSTESRRAADSAHMQARAERRSGATVTASAKETAKGFTGTSGTGTYKGSTQGAAAAPAAKAAAGTAAYRGGTQSAATPPATVINNTVRTGGGAYSGGAAAAPAAAAKVPSRSQELAKELAVPKQDKPKS